MQQHASVAIDKLKHIEQLWEQLRGTRIDTPEYKRIVNEIGVLSMEYHKIFEASEKSEK
jgi:hypothetical protein